MMGRKKKKKRQEKHLIMDNIDYMENFATEFSKHDVLMYPTALLKKKVADVQEARMFAYMEIAEALSINNWQMAQRQAMYFRQQCIQKMRRFVRLSLIRGGSGHEALELAPEWLKKLNPAFDLLNRALKMETPDDGSVQATRKRMTNFMWDLYGAVRDEMSRSDRPVEALHGHDAMRYYAEKVGLPFLTLYEIWNRLLQVSLRKMIEVRSSGDRPDAAHRPSQLEWRLINMALLYDLCIIVVHDDSFTNTRELNAMIQLYVLMCEAQIKFGGSRKNKKNKDIPIIGCEATNDGQNDPTPCCSSDKQSEQISEDEGFVWEVADLWKYVHNEYIKRGRAASMVLLQRRWHELRQLTRRSLLDAFRVRDLHPHPLLLAIGKRFPSVVTSPLPAWSELVADGLVFSDANLALQKQKEYSQGQFPSDASIEDVTTDLLDWSDDDVEIIESNREVIDIASDSDTEPNTNDTNILDKSINQPKENFTKSVQKSDNDTIIDQPTTIKPEYASESTQKNLPDKKENTSSNITAVVADTSLPLNQLHLTKTKVRIIFEDESDLEELDRMNSNKSLSDEDNYTEERNKSLSSVNYKLEIKNKNENIQFTIAYKENAINESGTSGYNTGIINKNALNVDTENYQRNADSVVKSTITNEINGKYKNTFSSGSKTDKLSKNAYKIKETNKNVINAGNDAVERNTNSLCQRRKSSLSPNKFQKSDESKDLTIRNEDNFVENVDSAKDPEKEIKANNSSDGCLLSERSNPSCNFDNKLAIKKTVVANHMIGSDILNILSKQIAEYPEDSNSLIKHTKAIFKMNSSSDQNEDRPISELKSFTNITQDALIIDSKLLKLSRVVLTPLEDIPVWRVKSRNGTINCRTFSTKKFAAAPIITSEMLPFCRRYPRPSPFGRTYIPSHRRRIFTGLNTKNSQLLAQLPADIKAIRKKLTRQLKLSKTYYTVEFWSDPRNLKKLAMCVPVTVRMEKLTSRVVKKVELADIDEVRRINRTILTAQVAPNNVTSTRTPVATSERRLSDVSSSLSNTFVTTSLSSAPTIVPTKEELKTLIKDLVLPSIKGTCTSQEPRTAKQKTNRSLLWRIDDKKLDNDIRDVVEILSSKEQSKKAKSKSKNDKNHEKKNRKSISLSEEPLDAYAEWERQKTCTHKYFNFTTPFTFGKIKNDKKHVDEPKLVKNDLTNMTFAGNLNANVEMVDLMNISDDEENALVICEDSKEYEENVSLDNANDITLTTMDSLKRPNSGNAVERCKRRKLSNAISDSSNSKSTESSSNDCDVFVIDDNEPVRDESISPKATINAAPEKLMASVLGLKTNVRPSKVVYIVNTSNATDSRTTTIVTTHTASVKHKSIGIHKLPSANSSLLIPKFTPTLLKSTSQSPQKTISLISTEPDTQNLTLANTSSGSQTMLSLISSSTGNNIPLSVNSTLSNSDAFTSFSSTLSQQPKDSTHQSREMVTLRPTVVFQQTSTLTSTKNSASLNPTFSNTNKLSPLNSKLSILKKQLPLNLKSIASLDSTIHDAVKVDSNEPITSNVVTSPSLMSSAQSVTTECTVGANKNNIHIQDRIIHAADAEIDKPAAVKCEPHIVIDATVKSSGSSDEVSRTNVNNCNKMNVDERSLLRSLLVPPIYTISTNHTILNNGSSSESNAKLETEVNPRIVCITSLAEKDNSKIATSYNKTKAIRSESHMNEINPNIHSTFIKSEVICPTPLSDNDKLGCEENKVDNSHSSGNTESLNTMPVITSVSSLAPRLRVKDEFKFTNFDLTPQQCSSISSRDGYVLDIQEQEPETIIVTSKSIDIVEQQKESKDSPVETTFGSVLVKCEVIETEDENLVKKRSGIKTSVIVKTVQSGKKTKKSDDDDEREKFANDGCPDTLLVGMMTSYKRWTAASEVHTNQRTGDDISLYFRLITDLGAYAVPVEEYTAQIKDPDEVLLKIDATRAWWVLNEKFVLLTDDPVPCHRAVYLTSMPVGNIAPYTVLLFPLPDGRRLTLDMGAKKGRDVVVCGCTPGRDLCPLCESLAQNKPDSPPERTSCRRCGVTATRERTPLLRLRQRAYRKVSDRPLKYVYMELRRECRGCRDGVQFVADPEAVLINGKAYEKISRDPLMYSPVLSVVQNAQSCSALVKREAELYLLNLRSNQRHRLLYRADDKHKVFNKAVSSLMARLDREETTSLYRLQMKRSGRIE